METIPSSGPFAGWSASDFAFERFSPLAFLTGALRIPPPCIEFPFHTIHDH